MGFQYAGLNFFEALQSSAFADFGCLERGIFLVQPCRFNTLYTYNAYGKAHCTQHRVNEDMFRDVVLENIRTFAKAAEISQADIMTKL